MKDPRTITGSTRLPTRDSCNNNKLKDSWNCNNNSNNNSSSSYSYGTDQDFLCGFSWPPRSYTCSFCKREFRSAQALGGHMNVHRRDRARLRIQQSPPKDGPQYPFINLNLNPNPNPNFSTPSSNFSPSLITCATTLPSLASSPLSTLSSPPSSGSPSEIKTRGKEYGNLVDHHHHHRRPNSPRFKPLDLIDKRSAKSLFKEEKGLCNFSKRGEILRLDLEIGLISDEPNDDDLDLELRLGYA